MGVIADLGSLGYAAVTEMDADYIRVYAIRVIAGTGSKYGCSVTRTWFNRLPIIQDFVIHRALKATLKAIIKDR